MAWRAFVDEMTPEGLHIIFTNDDTLDETTIRNVWDAPAKQAANPKLRRFGKVAVLNTQAEVEEFCAREIAALEAADVTDVSVGTFVSLPTAPPVPDSTVDAKVALRDALADYETAVKLQEAIPTFDVTKFKQAVVDAKSALDAVNAGASKVA